MSPAYRALFDGERNIAVYLGKASGGLCAIDFDADEDLAAFLAVNPKLRGTLQTRGSRGGMLWLRISPTLNPQPSHHGCSSINGAGGGNSEGRRGDQAGRGREVSLRCAERQNNCGKMLTGRFRILGFAWSGERHWY